MSARAETAVTNDANTSPDGESAGVPLSASQRSRFNAARPRLCLHEPQQHPVFAPWLGGRARAAARALPPGKEARQSCANSGAAATGDPGRSGGRQHTVASHRSPTVALLCSRPRSPQRNEAHAAGRCAHCVRSSGCAALATKRPTAATIAIDSGLQSAARPRCWAMHVSQRRRLCHKHRPYPSSRAPPADPRRDPGPERLAGSEITTQCEAQSLRRRGSGKPAPARAIFVTCVKVRRKRR